MLALSDESFARNAKGEESKWWAREESNPLVTRTTGLRPASDPTRQRARKGLSVKFQEVVRLLAPGIREFRESGCLH